MRTYHRTPAPIGETYGNYTVLSETERPDGVKRKSSYWLCRCSCGTIKPVASDSLKSGVRSCGCIPAVFPDRRKHRPEAPPKAKAPLVKSNPEYAVWAGMKARCNDRKGKRYRDYGGRGIRVCERWNTFENFLSDMGKRPAPIGVSRGDHYSIERRDVNGNYCPENCYWALIRDQSANRRCNVMLTHNGKTQPLERWANELGINKGTLSGRLRYGWTAERALTTPTGKYSQRTTKPKGPGTKWEVKIEEVIE